MITQAVWHVQCPVKIKFVADLVDKFQVERNFQASHIIVQY